jgi:hypothetical protein
MTKQETAHAVENAAHALATGPFVSDTSVYNQVIEMRMAFWRDFLNRIVRGEMCPDEVFHEDMHPQEQEVILQFCMSPAVPVGAFFDTESIRAQIAISAAGAATTDLSRTGIVTILGEQYDFSEYIDL